LICERKSVKKYFSFWMLREHRAEIFRWMHDPVGAIHHYHSIDVAGFLGRPIVSLVFQVGCELETNTRPRVVDRCRSDRLPWRAGMYRPTAARHSSKI